jgi:C_GCAxxG_C_C family probable redox protein
MIIGWMLNANKDVRIRRGKMESKEIRKKAYGHFESGLHCAEVISKTILEMFSEEPQPAVIRSASGFGGGIGGSTEEICGAFTGGVVALGYLLGRENGGGSLLNGFKEQQNPLGCVKLTAETTVILARLLDELGLKAEIHPNTFSGQPREKLELGQCPFSA